MRDLLSTLGVRIISLTEMCFCGGGERRVTEGEKLTWYKDICSQSVRKKFLIELTKSHFAVWLLIFDKKNPSKQVRLLYVPVTTCFGPSRPSRAEVQQNIDVSISSVKYSSSLCFV